MTAVAFQPSEKYQVAERIFRMPLENMFFIEAPKNEDFRGFYSELSIIPDLSAQLDKKFIPLQWNHAHSVTKVARGFHAEQWNKLVTVVHGTCFCAWVDLRPTSATYGQAVTMILGNETEVYGSVFVPQGVGNAYLVTQGPAEYIYATDGIYRDRDPRYDVAVSLFDDDIGIEWPIPRLEMILSQRDKQAVKLRDLRP